MKSSMKRGLILTIIVVLAAGVFYSTSVGMRATKLSSIANRESTFQFMSFELRHFGKVTIVDEVQLPPQP